jgi:hypothetical protein
VRAERGGIVNQMRAQLGRYFPAFLEVASDPGEDWAIALFSVMSDHQAATHGHPSKIAKLLRDRRIRRTTPEQVLATLRSTPVHADAGTGQGPELKPARRRDHPTMPGIGEVRRGIETALAPSACCTSSCKP